MEDVEYRKMYQLEATHWWFVSKRGFIKQTLNVITKKLPQILDIGCGTGQNLELLSAYGQAWGIDVSALAIKFCRQRHLSRVKQASVEKLPFPQPSFDLVTVFDVLYHQGIKNDAQVLKEIYRQLKPGGYLLITDCAHQWLFGPHDLAMHARQRYSKAELETKVRQAGFSLVRSSYIFMLTFPMFLINRMLNKYLRFRIDSDVQSLPGWLNKIFIFINKIEIKAYKLINLPFGSSIIILAQK